MDKLNAKVEQVKGGLKETAGKLTDNKKVQAEGAVEKVAGKIKEGIATAKDAVVDAIDQLKQ